MSMITTSATLCPDKPGGRRCLCHGTFLAMKRGSGWIHPIEEIDHPSALWNQGDIYVSEKHIFPGVSLEAGDSVVFYLYVDAKGLGAENVVQVWHEQAQAMRAMKSAKEINDISFAHAFLAVSTLIQATAPVVTSNVKPNVMPASMAVDLSCFYDDDDEEESDADSDLMFQHEHAKPIQISLSDHLVKREPLDFPSVGSASHASGNCKLCSFFPKGTCTNGSACEFCHFEHDKRPRPQKNKGKRVRERQKAHLVRAAALAAGAVGTPKNEEPMKCEVSPFLMTIGTPLKKDLFPAAGPTTYDSTDEGSTDEGSDTSTWGSPASFEREPGSYSPPPGLAPPPPSFPPPPMPEFLSAGSG